MQCSQLLFGTVLLGVVVLVYLTTSAQCLIEYKELYQSKLTHNFKLGKRKRYDSILVKTIETDADLNRPKISRDIRYPRTVITNCKITYIEVNDRGNGGYVCLKSGGPGNNFVVFHFETKMTVKFEFEIIIFGYENSMLD